MCGRTGELSVDEMTLSLKSTIAGMCKIAGVDVPPESQLESIARNAFSLADKDNSKKIAWGEFLEYVTRNPETKSWLNFFDDLPDASARPAINSRTPSVVKTNHKHNVTHRKRCAKHVHETSEFN